MATPTSQPNSMEPVHPESVEPGSQSNELKAEEELKKDAEQRFRRDSDEMEEMEGLLPIVNLPDRRVQIEEWTKEAQQFETDFSDMEMKIHRFPGSLQNLGKRYIVPLSVSIGPYHHNSSNLQEMEKVKRVAAHHFISKSGSGHTFDEIYAAVFSLVGTCRSLYDTKLDVGDAELADMMFIDGCFLLQFMLVYTGHRDLPQSLLSCLMSNTACISNDIMLLENQVPWLVVDTLRRFRSVPVEEFICTMGTSLQIRVDLDMESFVLDSSSMSPHLLGIIWFYKTGSRSSRLSVSNSGPFISISQSISAVELGEIGIKLTDNKTAKYADMGVKRGFLSSEIFLAPLLLDDITSCFLVNMAAFEVSVGMASWAQNDSYEVKAVVCSYIAVLVMLMDREEDVHELRSKHLVQAELTDKETLDFFKMLVKRICPGPLYVDIMKDIGAYKRDRRIWIKVHGFVYKHYKAIATVLSIIGVLVGIFETLLSLKKQ